MRNPENVVHHIAPDCPAWVDKKIREEAAAKGEQVIPAKPFPWNRATEPATEPTEQGNQYVIPGCEKDRRPEANGPVLNMDYETRLAMIVTHAWETWTKNGLGLDAEEREETAKSVRDAATNCYVEDISDSDWLAATLTRLGP